MYWGRLGLNRLGVLLMQVRDEIRNENKGQQMVDGPFEDDFPITNDFIYAMRCEVRDPEWGFTPQQRREAYRWLTHAERCLDGGKEIRKMPSFLSSLADDIQGLLWALERDD